MKKEILIVVFVLSTISLLAQFNFSLSGGYAIGVNKLRAPISSNSDTAFGMGIETYNKIGYGTGFCPSFRVGYVFNNNFDFGLTISYLKSNNQILYKNGTELSTFYMYKDAQSNAVFTGVDMAYHLNAGFYLGFGLFLNAYQQTNGNDNLNITPGSTMMTIRRKYIETAKMSLGSNFRMGYAYEFENKLSVFAEIDYTIMNLTSQKGHYTSYMVNGTEGIETLQPYESSWEGYKELESNNQLDPEQPEKRLLDASNTLSFSSVGMHIGIRYILK